METGPNGRVRRGSVMLRPHPSLLRELVERCETLRRHAAFTGSERTRCQLEDASYTLCVVTGTRQLDQALYVARRHLADAMRRKPPLRL
ncbi:DUF5133 domain-containing protein [Streptomyces massasporeus]|uniref:DUF5133 domain-containing protein n=1 Tax=Streptomyces massasporeus TaxID=67324 RepID=UPI00340ABD53